MHRLIVTCILCVTALSLGLSFAAAQNAARQPDAFYDAPVQIAQRGALLRTEPLRDVTLPAGVRGWRILYATSVDDRTPATAVATVFAPIHAPPGPRPVILWDHASTGLVQRCMPSLLSSPMEGVAARERIAGEGWVMVATDYSFAEKDGPHPFFIGEGEARATLDAFRAARQMRELHLDTRAVVWGHSQGGHAALWTGAIAQAYAPDLHILGVAAIAPAADPELILRMNSEVDRRVGPYLATAYARFYPEINFESILRSGARPVAREMASLCGFSPPQDLIRMNALVAQFSGPALVHSNATLRARIAQNTANRPIAAPLLIAQGGADIVIPALATSVYVSQRCDAGQRLDFWSFPDLDHGTIVQPGSKLDDPLVDWTRARFAGEPQPSGCARRTF